MRLVHNIASGFVSNLFCGLFLHFTSFSVCSPSAAAMVMDKALTSQVCNNDDCHHNSGDVDLLGIDVFIGFSLFSAHSLHLCHFDCYRSFFMLFHIVAFVKSIT